MTGRRSLVRVLTAATAVLSTVRALTGAPPPLVVETDPLPPEQQRQQFHLDPGFEIQLVASDPDIGQPMNLQFDAAGRLWVTHSVQYPYPADAPGVEPRDDRFPGMSESPPRDRLSVIEGIGADGRPARIRHVLTDLNIPIGQLPLYDAHLVYSIPAVWKVPAEPDVSLDDARPLIAPFGNVDTHGMVNSLTRGFDGGVYACHGFRNESVVTALGGPIEDRDTLTLQSGNTFRFRPDGSALQQWTWGQVNPFGLAFDPWGRLYSADCHSRPVTMLLPGAYYPSFGKPHDGLGFGPDMIDHSHGSTGICGVAWYEADQFPAEYQNQIFLCNPVTGRVHRDALIEHGATLTVDSQPDFIRCDDPWFRPVDVQLGPDGALYVADFYNAIIGHYEVPLEHPKRDRRRGRIWRIVYAGEGMDATDTTVEAPSDLTGLSTGDLIDRLSSDNLRLRMSAMHLLVDRDGAAAVPELHQMLAEESSPEQRAHGLWVLERVGALDDVLVLRLADDDAPLVRNHLARALGERHKWIDTERHVVDALLTDPSPRVQMAAAEAIGRHLHTENVSRLLEILPSPDDPDTHLRHTVRIALRNHLRDSAIAASLLKASWSPEQLQELASVALAVESHQGVAFILKWLRQAAVVADGNIGSQQLISFAAHVAEHGTAEQVEGLVGLVKGRLPQPQAVQLLQAVAESAQAAGQSPSVSARQWAAEIAEGVLEQIRRPHIGWMQVTLDGLSPSTPRFGIGKRNTPDGEPLPLYSSFVHGEAKTGMLRSDVFPAPPKLRFFLAGHNGPPKTESHGRNIVRLRSASNGRVIRTVRPPRNDVALPVDWDLAEFENTSVQLEILDRDDGGAFAWLAVGGFSLAPLNPERQPDLKQLIRLLGSYQLPSVDRAVVDVCLNPAIPLSTRSTLAGTVESPHPLGQVLAELAAHPGLDETLRDALIDAALRPASADLPPLLDRVARSLSATQQRGLAALLAPSPAGAAELLRLIERGLLSGNSLRDPALREQFIAVLPDATSRLEQLGDFAGVRDPEIVRQISESREAFASATPDLESGRRLYTEHCAACHQFRGAGKKVGPQLDGVGARGIGRLLEDILDPNQNVDAAFATEVLALKSGRVITGLVRDEAETEIVLADQNGKEIRVPLADIEQRKKSRLSLMPANVVEKLTREQLFDLVAFLRSE